VEVISWEGVSRPVLDYLFWFFAKTGKAPVITDNAICFILDRIFDNWCNESAYLLDQATASQIDKVAEEFVFAGPFFVLNMANGNPIIIETNSLQMEEGSHYMPAPILGSVDRWLTHRPGSPVAIDDEIQNAVRDRLLGILFSQSFDIIDRGIGTKANLNFGCQVVLGLKKGRLISCAIWEKRKSVALWTNLGAKDLVFPSPKNHSPTTRTFIALFWWISAMGLSSLPSDGLGPVCTGLCQSSDVYGSNGQTGGRSHQWPGPGGRLGNCRSMSSHGCGQKCHIAVS
jgi:hypothetical protein